jgi:DNA-directed RNA polymerase subunit RPC12/RpoP
MGGRRIKAYTAIGRSEGVCPYCRRELPAWPARSAPCPHCGSEILVRTRPLDRERVLVTEAQADELEAQWSLFRERGGGSPLRPLLNEEELEVERGKLRIRLEREPNPFDVASSLISHRAFEHMRRLELASYRDFGLARASLLDQQGRTEDALAGYLGVCFLDLNGARNPPQHTATGAPVRSVDAATGFSPDNAFLAPPVIARCIQIIATLDQDEDTVRGALTAFVERQYQTLRPPRRPAEIWPMLGEAIFGTGFLGRAEGAA